MNQHNTYIKDSYSKNRRIRSINKIVFLIAGLFVAHPLDKDIPYLDDTHSHALRNQFNEKLFETQMHQIAFEAQKALDKHYSNNKRQVKISQISRNLHTQQKLLKQGFSQTGLSLHQLGAACDFEILLNGKKVTGTGKSMGGLHESIEPYRILGGIAKKYGYFWGLPWDSGHVASERYISDFLVRNPKYLDHIDVVEYYNYLSNLTKIDIKYQRFVEIMDKKHGIFLNRVFTGEHDIDELLTPVY